MNNEIINTIINGIKKSITAEIKIKSIISNMSKERKKLLWKACFSCGDMSPAGFCGVICNCGHNYTIIKPDMRREKGFFIVE